MRKLILLCYFSKFCTAFAMTEITRSIVRLIISTNYSKNDNNRNSGVSLPIDRFIIIRPSDHNVSKISYEVVVCFGPTDRPHSQRKNPFLLTRTSHHYRTLCISSDSISFISPPLVGCCVFFLSNNGSMLQLQRRNMDPREGVSSDSSMNLFVIHPLLFSTSVKYF